MPDNVWAVDARSGREVWHYKYPPNEGGHIGQRGVAMLGNWIYTETPDCNLVSLNAKDGKERWRKQIADAKLEYFCTMSPLVVGNHIITGVGGDSLDNPGYLESRDPETGEMQWHWNTEPNPGEPGSESWPDAEARNHGGGMTWMTGTYDPDLRLIYWGIGNPNPVHAGTGRKGDNLWTCSIVALNVDTGKLVWGYQVSPHDTHDWDATQTPILFDGGMFVSPFCDGFFVRALQEAVEFGTGGRFHHLNEVFDPDGSVETNGKSDLTTLIVRSVTADRLRTGTESRDRKRPPSPQILVHRERRWPSA